MAKRNQQPPADPAAGAGQAPAAAAPGMATGLNKYFSPSLQALTGGTMDSPLASPRLDMASAFSAAYDAGARKELASLLANPVRRFGIVRHRCLTFLTKETKDMKFVDIARVCHEVNRAYCASLGDYTQPPWENAPEWQKQSAITGVQFTIANPDAPPSASHDSWLAEKERDGWKYGPVKDAEKKEHPCFVPYDQLPAEQKAKDYLFQGVVRALVSHLEQ